MPREFDIESGIDGGERYKLVDGEAKGGDVVTYVQDGKYTKICEEVGAEVVSFEEEVANIPEYTDMNGDDVCGIYREFYRVLEPIESGEESPDLDLIANLARRVHELEERLDSAEKDVKTFAEIATEADYKAGQALTSVRSLSEASDRAAEAVDMLTDDIVLLDERTQPLVEDNTDGLAKELAEEVIKRIREAIE